MKVVVAVTSSRDGLERGDSDIGDPVDEQLEVEDIVEDANDVLREDS